VDGFPGSGCRRHYPARVPPVVPGSVDRGDRGSTLPFVLVCWLVAALMVFGAIAASDAFLKQQQVQSVCDSAALAAADRADEAAVYTGGVGPQLPLTRSAAEAAVADQLADADVGLDAWSATTDGVEVTVRCTRSVQIAFSWLFLGGRPLERTAVASARAPTVP
jgi:Flp pilus assembly protein TadG